MTYVFTAIAWLGTPRIVLPPGSGATEYADPARAFSAMATAGFDDLRLVNVGSQWPIENAAAPFDYFIDGTVRGGALLRPQPDVNKTAIRAAVLAAVLANHGAEGPWVVPLPSVVISGRAV